MKCLRVMAVALSFLIAGCASVSTINISDPDRLAVNESEFPERATIYVFRGTGNTGAMYSFQVSLDQTKIGLVRKERYFAFPATPGTHWLTVTCPSICDMPGFKINLDVAANKTYYFMIEPNLSLGYYSRTMTSHITQIDKAFADRLMETYKRSKSAGP